MLGKTAGSLFWMARYLERSENNARLIDAGFRIALTRSQTAPAEWRSILETAGVDQAFLATHDDYSSARVVDFLLRDCCQGHPAMVAGVTDAAQACCAPG